MSRVVYQGTYELTVELGDWDGNIKYAKYSTFRIGNKTEKYKLTIGGYSGDAGKDSPSSMYAVCTFGEACIVLR